MRLIQMHGPVATSLSYDRPMINGKGGGIDCLKTVMGEWRVVALFTCLQSAPLKCDLPGGWYGPVMRQTSSGT